MFFIAKDEDIKNGKTTDVYFIRTKEILDKENVRNRVIAEFTTQSRKYPWNVFAGLEEVIRLLEGLPINVWALPEGTIFPSKDNKGIPIPVMVIEGIYNDFTVYETPVLGLICESSGIATKSARIRKVAGEKTVLSFGIRRMHPAIAPMIDRSAYIGGCDGVSSLIGAETIGKKPTGTIPHALIINLGSGEVAIKAFDRYIDESVPRIALVDTYQDEKYEAVRAAEAIRDKLFGVRLDTPRSRRGSFPDIIREVKWELKIRGFENVKIIVSGGLDEYTIPELIEAGADSFGVGTSVSNADTIDFAMDIVELEGKPVAKRGKFGGRKSVFRREENGRFVYEVVPSGSKSQGEELLVQVIKDGKRVYTEKNVDKIRDYVLKQLEKFEGI